MAFEKISEIFSQFSFENILRGDFSSFQPLFYLIISIAIYSIIIWHFYRFIARRDCFKLTPRRHVKIIQFLKYFFLFPFVAFLFFAGFSLMLLFLTKSYEVSEILSISFALITAIRITAYYSGDLSKDVAKMLPFALLGIFLVDASYFRIEDIIDKAYELPDFFVMALQFIIFIIFVEWILRVLLVIKRKIIPTKQQNVTEQ